MIAWIKWQWVRIVFWWRFRKVVARGAKLNALAYAFGIQRMPGELDGKFRARVKLILNGETGRWPR